MTSPSGNSDHKSDSRHPGDYLFADLAHLDKIIAKWDSIVDEIRVNAKKIEQAISPVEPPAHDLPSERQAGRYAESLELARRHSLAMSEYAAAYADRLNASRAQYIATEQTNVHELRRTAGG